MDDIPGFLIERTIGTEAIEHHVWKLSYENGEFYLDYGEGANFSTHTTWEDAVKQIQNDWYNFTKPYGY